MGGEQGVCISLMQSDISGNDARPSTPPREAKQRFKVSMTLVGLPVFLPRRHIFLINDSCNEKEKGSPRMAAVHGAWRTTCVDCYTDRKISKRKIPKKKIQTT